MMTLQIMLIFWYKVSAIQHCITNMHTLFNLTFNSLVFYFIFIVVIYSSIYILATLVIVNCKILVSSEFTLIIPILYFYFMYVTNQRSFNMQFFSWAYFTTYNIYYFLSLQQNLLDVLMKHPFSSFFSTIIHLS